MSKWLTAGGKEVSKLVKDPTWQRLRESFVGTWKKTPEENVRKLKHFLGENPSESKLRIVLNYLTGSGFRSGNIKNKSADALREWVRKKLAIKREALAEKYIAGTSVRVSNEPLDFDKLYNKVFRITYNSGNKNQEGWSIVTPLNGEAWNWDRPKEDDPTFQQAKANIKANFNSLENHKYNQIYDTAVQLELKKEAFHKFCDTEEAKLRAKFAKVPNKIPGGLAKNKSISDFLTKWNISEESFQDKVNAGIKIELEHTSDATIAEEIAFDHLWENINYYENLAKMEKKASFAPTKITLYDFPWQSLRTDLNFYTYDDTVKSVERVKKYVGNEKDISKVWRALNLMAATRMGFSGVKKLIKSKEKMADRDKRDKYVQQYREHLTSVYAELKADGKKVHVPSEEELLDQLKKVPKEDFDRVLASLTLRYENAVAGKTPSGAVGGGTRPELKYYLSLMHKVKGPKKAIKAAAKRAFVDFDGTIAKDDVPFPQIGKEMPGAREALQKLKDLGYKIVIYSVRANSQFGKKQILDWLEAHSIPFDELSNPKPNYDLLIDDKALQIGHGRSWEDVLSEVELRQKASKHAEVPATEAKKIGQEILKVAKPHLTKYEFVGALRRKTATVRDVDILAIGNLPEVAKVLDQKFQVKPTAVGKSILRFLYKEVVIDFFFVPDEEAWGAALLYRTGPDISNIAMRKKAKNKGWKLNEHGLFDETGKLIASKTEEEIYKALDMRYLTPEERQKEFIKEAAMEHKEGVGALIKNKQGKILALWHNRLSAWSIPVGHVDPGEDPETAMKREVKEEVNIDVLKAKLVGKFDSVYEEDGQKNSYTNYLYEVLDWTGEVANNEPTMHETVTWMSPDTLANLKDTTDLTSRGLPGTLPEAVTASKAVSTSIPVQIPVVLDFFPGRQLRPREDAKSRGKGPDSAENSTTWNLPKNDNAPTEPERIHPPIGTKPDMHGSPEQYLGKPWFDYPTESAPSTGSEERE